MAGSAKSVLAPGTRFGRYEVVADIASGGMAMVYLARALGAAGFQRLVAIKLMHAQYANDEDFVGMFMDEARLAARIRHPNVVATLDLENDDDGLYLVMEFIEGDTLIGLLRSAAKAGKRIPPAITLRIVLDMLNGLHAAHELTGDTGEPLRLVHRDVSPHNVLVGIDGISRITDFGIARAEERVSSTRNGQVKGKIAYMAPEQTTGATVDRRVDLFATGVVLWEALAGKRLFAGDSDGEVLRKLLVNPIPRVRELVPTLPDALEQVCIKALERDPDLRYATAAQMADALETAGGSLGIASNRAVSQFVKEISGAKLATIQERVRGAMSADTSAAQSAIRTVRRREGTDPERTTQRAESDMQIAPGTGSKKIPAPVALPPPVTDLSDQLEPEPEPPKRSRAPRIAIVAIVAIAVLGAGGYAWFGRHLHATDAASLSQRPATPAVQDTTAAAAADLPGAASGETPRNVVEHAPADHPATAPTPEPSLAANSAAAPPTAIAPSAPAQPTAPSRTTSRTSSRPRPAAPSGTGRPHTGSTGTPAAGTFNPESM